MSRIKNYSTFAEWYALWTYKYPRISAIWRVLRLGRPKPDKPDWRP